MIGSNTEGNGDVSYPFRLCASMGVRVSPWMMAEVVCRGAMGILGDLHRLLRGTVRAFLHTDPRVWASGGGGVCVLTWALGRRGGDSGG